jgi:RND superfamily putative drug exporter
MSSSVSSTMQRPSRTRAGYPGLITGRRTKWVVLVFWLLLLAVGGSFGSKIGSAQNNEAQTWLPNNAESTRAVNIAERHFADKNISTAVVVYSRPAGLTAADVAAINQTRDTLGTGHTAAAPISPVQIAKDRQAALITVPLQSSPSNNTVLGDAVDHVRDLARAAAPPGLTVAITGEAGTASDFIHVFSGLDGALLGATIGVVAVILLLTYRSPVLWLVPLLAAGGASQVAGGLVYLLAKHAGLLVNGQSAYILTVLVLGVATDYALLLVARYREELRRHTDRHQAMAAALRRCLPPLTASAGTVIIATFCLVFGTMNSTRGLGPVCAIGVAVAYLTMTTLLPALLVILGRWVFWPAIPRPTAVASRPAAATEPALSNRTASRGTEPQWAASEVAGHRAWAAVARRVGARPRPIWIGAAVVLAALAVGSLTLHTGQTSADQFTTTVDSVTGQQILQAHFAAGSAEPANLYAPTAQADAALTAARHVPGVVTVQTVASAQGWTHAIATLTEPPDTAAARDTVQQLRAAVHHAAPGTLVGGQTAVALDTRHAESSEQQLLIPIILAVVLVVLVLLLRALVAPFVLLLSVVLSYAAAVGTAALLYRALGHSHIDRSLLLIGFLFLVALGVDYTIFLMTRAREEVAHRGHRLGILTALTVTGGVITSAGLVLAATFSVLAVLPVVSSLQQGVLIAVGVLLDTFIVRSLLVPALALDIGPRLWAPSLLSHEQPPTFASARAHSPHDLHGRD